MPPQSFGKMVHCLMPKCAPEHQNHTKFKLIVLVHFVLDVPVSDQLYSNANFEQSKKHTYIIYLL